MKKLIALLVLSFLYSCGSGGGSSDTTSNHAPAISNLYLSPASANVGQGSGAVTIYGHYNFIDSDANITSAVINWSDTLGQSGTLSFDSGLNGYSAGSAYFTVVGDTAVASTTSFEFYLTDSTGLQSNKLTGTWTVSP